MGIYLNPGNEQFAASCMWIRQVLFNIQIAVSERTDH